MNGAPRRDDEKGTARVERESFGNPLRDRQHVVRQEKVHSLRRGLGPFLDSRPEEEDPRRRHRSQSRAAATRRPAPFARSSSASALPRASASPTGASPDASSRSFPSGERTDPRRRRRPSTTSPRAPTGAPHPPRRAFRRLLSAAAEA